MGSGRSGEAYETLDEPDTAPSLEMSSYDYANRLASVSRVDNDQPIKIEYEYGPLGRQLYRRVVDDPGSGEVSEEKRVWDGVRLLEMYEDNDSPSAALLWR